MILGVFSVYSPFPLIGCFYLIMLVEIPKILYGDYSSKKIALINTMSYLVSFELLARMAKTSPFIPYELGKYLLFILLVVGIVNINAKKHIGWILLVLLIPSLVFDISNQVTFNNIVFNIIGPINVALAVIFFKGITITKQQFIDVLKLLLLPAISVMAFIVVKTPEFDKIDFALGANAEASGGFGSNQVATILGFGAFITFLFWINKWRLSGNRIIDAGVLLGFVFQGLLTFSRGGVIGGVLGIIIVLIYISVTSEKVKKMYSIPKVGKYVLPLIGLLVITFTIADNITGGNLLLRYQGETSGTLAGTKEKDINSITSHRANIFIDDLNLWAQYPIFGVGVGASKYLRGSKVEGQLAHIEFSRLLSEHGILGGVFFVLLLTLIYDIYKLQGNPHLKSILLALFIIAIYTTFHAAMRTYISTLLIGISLIKVHDLPNNLINQPIKK